MKLLIIILVLLILFSNNNIENFSRDKLLNKCFSKNILDSFKKYESKSLILKSNNGIVYLTPTEIIDEIPYIPFAGKGFFLNNLCVDPNHRRKGIATKLIKLSEKKARDNNRKYLLIQISDKNEKAINVFEKNGFVEIMDGLDNNNNKFLYLIKNFSVESFTNQDKNALFQDMMKNHYNKMFPLYTKTYTDPYTGDEKTIVTNRNRNAAGFVFFKYLYDNLINSIEMFDIYNQFYCGVSGSIVGPDRQNNFSILKVKDMNGKCVIGKYYRCCTPCNCDIMKYTRVVKGNIKITDDNGNVTTHERNLLTIGDPCDSSGNKVLPEQVDNVIFSCNNNKLINGYRVNSDGEIGNEGRLIIGVLHNIQLDENNMKLLEDSVNGCVTGEQRFLTPPSELKWGMGDIFVNVALMNDSTNYSNDQSDFCS